MGPMSKSWAPMGEDEKGRCCCPTWTIILFILLGIFLLVALTYYATRDEKRPTSGSSSTSSATIMRRPSGPSRTELERQRREKENLERLVSLAGAPFPTCPTNPNENCHYKLQGKECKCPKRFYWNTRDGKARGGFTNYTGAHSPKGWVKSTSVKWKLPSPIVNGKIMNSQGDTTIIERWGPNETPSWWGRY